jgi:hypothetical protein
VEHGKLTWVFCVPKVRGFDKDISKRCVFDVKTTMSYRQPTDEEIRMNLIRYKKYPKLCTLTISLIELTTLKEFAFFL